MQLTFKIAMTLGPLQSTDLAIDVPTRIRAFFEEGTTFPRPTLAAGTTEEQHKVEITFDVPGASDTHYLRVNLGVGHTSSVNRWACVAQNFGYSDLGINKAPCRDKEPNEPR